MTDRATASDAVAPVPAVQGLSVLATCELVPWLSCGGSDHVAWQLARRLAGWGASIRLVAAVPNGSEPLDERREGVRVVGLQSLDLTGRLGVELTLARGIGRTLAALSSEERPAVIHANSLHFPSSLSAAVFARRRRIPLVTTAHIGSLSELPPLIRTATTVYEHTAGRFILGVSREVIAVSAPVAEHVRGLTKKGTPVRVITNGVDQEVFFPDPQKPERATPHIVFVGRLIGNKGPQLLLEALGQLGRAGVPFSATFAGAGPLHNQLVERASELGLSGAVDFAGPVIDVAARLRQADVLVRPSQTEGMPLGVLEALASGTCVVASDVPGNSDLVQHNVNGLLVDVRSADSLVRELRSVVESPVLRARLAKEGLRTAHRYGWDQAARGVADVRVRCAT